MLVLGNVDSVRDHFTSRKQYEAMTVPKRGAVMAFLPQTGLLFFRLRRSSQAAPGKAG